MEPYQLIANDGRILDSPYENKCEKCNGTTRYYDSNYRRCEVDCLYCNFTGYIITEQGEILLDFLKRRLKIKNNLGFE